jgi:multicomponent Na+:H+ antiporter subunit G
VIVGVVALCFAIGLFFQLIAAIGLFRFPDVYSRQHVVCITDTLGAPLMIVGAAIAAGSLIVALKLTLALVFLFVTGPLVSHMLARAALQSTSGAEKPPPAGESA